MKLSDRALLKLFKQKSHSFSNEMKVDQINGIVLKKMNIGSISVNMSLLKNVQFLSLQNNFLSSIDFLLHLPNLFYLDISKNSIEDFQPLNQISTFGFLKFTLGQFIEKRLLQLKGMTIGILEVDIVDKSLFKQFLSNSPNVILLNNDIIYFYDTFVQKENGRDGKKHRSIAMKKTTVRESCNSFFKNDKIALADNTPPSLEIRLNNDNDYSLQSSTHIEANTMSELNQLNSFYDYYNASIHLIIINMANPLTSAYLSSEEKYIELEKKKLKVLADVYSRIHQLNIHRKQYLIFGESEDEADYPTQNFHMLKVNDLQKQLIILVLLLLVMTQTISSSLTIEIVNFILLNFCQATESELFKGKSCPCTFILSFYYSIYDDLRERYSKAKENADDSKEAIQYEKYKWIIQGLKMDSLILKGNYFKELNKQNKTQSTSLLSVSLQQEHLGIKAKIEILKCLKITEEILPLIQFLADFVYLNQLDRVLSSDSLNDYVSLNELKEYLYHSSSKLCLSLSDKKYQHLKLSHLSNRYFLSKEHINHKSRVKPDEEELQTAKKLKEEMINEERKANSNYQGTYHSLFSNRNKHNKRVYIHSEEAKDAHSELMVNNGHIEKKRQPSLDFKQNTATSDNNNKADIVLPHLNKTHKQINNNVIIIDDFNELRKTNPIKLSKVSRSNNYTPSHLNRKLNEKVMNSSNKSIKEGLNSSRNPSINNAKSIKQNLLISMTKTQHNRPIQLKNNNIKDMNNLTEIKSALITSNHCFVPKQLLLSQSRTSKSSNRNKLQVKSFISKTELKSLVNIKKVVLMTSNLIA